MTIQIEQIDTTTASEELLLEMHEYYVSHDAEFHPDDPPMPVEQRLNAWRHIAEHIALPRWILRDGGEIVAVAVAYMDKIEDLNNGFARIHVKPEQRRQGLATRLAGPVLDYLDRDGRASVITDTLDGSPWEPTLERLGMKKALTERESRLLVADIDWNLMDAWIERASERATEYELLFFTTPIEDAHLQKWCDLMLVMNTAPREALEFEDFKMTPEKWRALESQDLARGEHLEGHVAVHKKSGDWVGLSEILVPEHHPEQAYQGDTGVDPAHRNKGLGRWLKAASIKKLVARHPNVVRVDTENAGSNEPMLNINVEMGYRPIKQSCAWQGDLATIRERLDV